MVSVFPMTAAVLDLRSTQIKTYSWDNAQVLLVGNKCDMDDERVVNGDRGRQLADHLGELTHTSTRYMIHEVLLSDLKQTLGITKVIKGKIWIHSC